MNQRQERTLRRELVKARQDLRGVKIALEVVLSEVVKLRQRAESMDAAAEVIARVQQSVSRPPVEQDQSDKDPDPWPVPAAPSRPAAQRRTDSCLRRRHGHIVRRPSPGGGR